MEYKLSDLFVLQMGKTPDRHTPEYWTDGKEQWISIADLSRCDKYIEETAENISKRAVNESGIKIIPANTVIMSFKLSIGKVAITPKPMYSNEAIMAFIDKGIIPIEPTYLYFLLMAKDWDEGTNKAVMGKTLNKATLSQIKVRIHNETEQREIVKVLEKAESIVVARQQQLTTLDTLIKARFVEMFGDVESNQFGWKKEPLKSHIDMLTGYPFDSSGYAESGIKICGGLIILPDKIKWDECKYWPDQKGYEQFLLAENDIVVALDRPWITDGFKIGMITANDLPALLIQRTARIRAKDMTQAFVLYLLKDSSFERQCTVTGSLVPHISNRDINNYPVIVPPIELQNQFAAFVTQVDKSKAAVQKALDEAQTLFDSLMQQYFG